MRFEDRIPEEYKNTATITTLQLNITQKCNLRCKHCHIMKNSENMEMSKEVMEDCLKFLDNHKMQTVDITGGEPTTHPNIVWFVKECLKRVDDLIIRTNAVDIDKNKDLMDLFENEKIKIVVSLPCYTQENVDSQRGQGVFNKVISNLKKLNEFGYGTTKELDLVYNPLGGFLPPEQSSLQQDYERELAQYNVKFNNLFTITNMPIGFFKDFLMEKGEFEDYIKLLEENYNEDTVENIMCRYQISVDSLGNLYDCDFNQAEKVHMNKFKNIKELINVDDLYREIVFKDYCYGCTAGSGSSCGGALDE